MQLAGAVCDADAGMQRETMTVDVFVYHQ